jgi:hypothetical protein
MGQADDGLPHQSARQRGLVPALRDARFSSVALASVPVAQTSAQPRKRSGGMVACARGASRRGAFRDAYSKLTADPLNVAFLTAFAVFLPIACPHVAPPV